MTLIARVRSLKWAFCTHVALLCHDSIAKKILDCAMWLTGVQLVVQFGAMSKQVVVLGREKSARKVCSYGPSYPSKSKPKQKLKWISKTKRRKWTFINICIILKLWTFVKIKILLFLMIYHNDPKFSDRYAWANCATQIRFLGVRIFRKFTVATSNVYIMTGNPGQSTGHGAVFSMFSGHRNSQNVNKCKLF